MAVRVTVEGGGSFELTDDEVGYLRDQLVVDGLHRRVAAALPPEPYQPKEGDVVQFGYHQAGPPVWSIPCDYLGTWRGWHVVRAAGADDTIPFLERPDIVFRRAEA